MHKKQARKLKQLRAKRTDQARRHSERERRKNQARLAFRVKQITPERKKYIAAHCSGKGNFDELLCTVCDKKILKKDLKAEKFVALIPNTDKTNEYFAHADHFYETDGSTATADQSTNFNRMYQVIMKKELKDLAFD